MDENEKDGSRADIVVSYLLTALGKTLSDNGSIMAASLAGNQVVMD